jgi:hypothetical protein
MTQWATWASYGGDARIWLALGLLAAAGAAVLAGIRLPLPVRFTQPGPAGRAAIIAAWATSTAALLVCLTIYIRLVIDDIHVSGLRVSPPRLTILPVTLTATAVLFAIINSRRSPDPQTRLASAAIGAIAAPMIFELPFDPIVIFRVHTVLPDPPPWTLVYVPMVLTEITTLLLLRLSPMVRLTRATFFCFALMLGVWAAWALAGFGYPSAPLPIALNITSKILAFVAAFTLFLPRQLAPGQAPQPENNEQAGPPARRGPAHLPTLPADMTLPPDNGGQINPFGMPPLADAGRLDTDQSGGSACVTQLIRQRRSVTGGVAALHRPAAVACIRAAAGRAGVPVRQACQDLARRPGPPAP